MFFVLTQGYACKPQRSLGELSSCCANPRPQSSSPDNLPTHHINFGKSTKCYTKHLYFVIYPPSFEFVRVKLSRCINVSSFIEVYTRSSKLNYIFCIFLHIQVPFGDDSAQSKLSDIMSREVGKICLVVFICIQ